MAEALSRGFHRMTELAATTATSVGVAVLVLLALLSGIALGFPKPWETSIHVGCGLISVLMLFVLHHTESQQTNAILLKLDELIHADEDADDDVIESEDEEIDDQEDLRDKLEHED